MLNNASQTNLLSRRAQRRLDTTTAPITSTPPMVGVPCFTPCSSARRWTSAAPRIGCSTFSARGFRNQFRRVANRDQLIHPECRCGLTNLQVSTLRFSAEFPHFPQYRDALSLGVELDQRTQCRFHRVWVGIVAVVQKLHATDF